MGGSTIQDFGQEGANEFLVRVEKAGVEDRRPKRSDKKGAGEKFGADKFECAGSSHVGPKIGEDLRRRGTCSVIAVDHNDGRLYMGSLRSLGFGAKFGLLFGTGAVIALIHDVLVTVGALMLANYEFDLTVVAALAHHRRFFRQRYGGYLRSHPREPAQDQAPESGKHHQY